MLDIKCLDNWKDFIFASCHEQIQNFLIQLSSFQSSLLNNQHEKSMILQGHITRPKKKKKVMVIRSKNETKSIH